MIKTLIQQAFRCFFCIPLQRFCNKNEKAKENMHYAAAIAGMALVLKVKMIQN